MLSMELGAKTCARDTGFGGGGRRRDTLEQQQEGLLDPACSVPALHSEFKKGGRGEAVSRVLITHSSSWRGL